MEKSSTAGDPLPSTSDADDRLCLVPYRWWKEAREPEDEGRGIPFVVVPQTPSSYSMKLINMFNSDLVFNLQRDDGSKEEDIEEGGSDRCYAFIPYNLWVQALEKHRNSALASGESGSSLSYENSEIDDYPLVLRISVMRETNILTVKITKRDNSADVYKRASKLFNAESEAVHIWDFSERTNLILMNEWNRISQDGAQRPDQEILSEVQVYTLLENVTPKRDDLSSQTPSPCSGCSVVPNGMYSNFQLGNHKVLSSLGLTGLENLGNTCFMNSAIQCLAHTSQLVDYFRGDYNREINEDNPLGMKGELALAFGELLRKLWAPAKEPVAPREFKLKLARFAPQFSGFNQHDSQELLAFLLDGLHEDLNRVKSKPYIESKDAADRPDEEVAEEYWGNHLARNDSIIVDICQGQYKSTLLCPVCSKVSVTFDPFMYLSLPLPSTLMRTMTITVFSTDGSMKPSEYTINVPKLGKLKDLIQELSVVCSLRDDESLLVAEVYASRIIRYLEEPSDSISLIRDEDRLAAYRLPKNMEGTLVVFVHQQNEEHYFIGKNTSSWKVFGVPLITSIQNSVNGCTIQKLFLELLDPFKRSIDANSEGNQEKTTTYSTVVNTEKEASSNISDANGTIQPMEEDSEVVNLTDDFQFYLTDEKSLSMQSKIDKDEQVSLNKSQRHLYVLVCWQNEALEKFDITLLSRLTEIYKLHIFPRRTQESCSLYACLEAFLKEEPLGPEDMWFCPGCKKHQQASKKLDLWRLPEILVIHLKRFSYSRYMNNKLETFVDFPIHDMDLSTYIVGKSGEASNHYKLYAVSNHYGNMGGGHYTAYAYHEEEKSWYHFDDRIVSPIAEESIKTAAAYVLFYRRIRPIV